MECCGQKILYFLEKGHGVFLSVPKIFEILAEKYKIKSKGKKNQVRGVVSKASKPREIIQMDTVDFGEVFAFTSVDIYTKEVDVVIRPSLTSLDGLIFLETCMSRRFNNHSDLIQTDGGPEFKDEFKNNESFNRSLRKECLGWIKYKQNQVDQLNNIVLNYLDRYHYHILV